MRSEHARQKAVTLLPVEPGTCIVVDVAQTLDVENFVVATVDLWPQMAVEVNALRSALQAPEQSSWHWTRRIGAVDLSAGACGLAKEVLESLGIPAEAHIDEQTLANVASASLIVDAIGPATWVCSSLPLGVSGIAVLPTQVAKLCMGAVFQTRGVSDARITAGGAALMRALGAFGANAPPLGRLVGQSHAVTRSDVGDFALRLMVLGPVGGTADDVAVLTFDIDDQTPEDLSIGLDRVRATPGVLNATVGMTMGKKGRMSFRVEVLARPERIQEAIDSCLTETTTIGLRWYLAQRTTLPRESKIVQVASGVMGGVKTVVRPGGLVTEKVEADVLAAAGGNLVERSLLKMDMEERSQKIHPK